MKADKNFDFYEFAGIVMPGAILVFGLAQADPTISGILPLKDMSLGSLGVFLILSYAAGHLIQSIGNLIESLWWKYSGMPTDWIRANKWPLVSPFQRDLLERQVASRLGMQSAFTFAGVEQKHWFGITRQMYAAVAAANRAGRIDTFNGNYGLNRGLAAALISVACVLLVKSLDNWPYTIFLIGGSFLALYRMHRFARHYARELFVQFLQLPTATEAPKADGKLGESDSTGSTGTSE